MNRKSFVNLARSRGWSIEETEESIIMDCEKDASCIAGQANAIRRLQIETGCSECLKIDTRYINCKDIVWEITGL